MNFVIPVLRIFDVKKAEEFYVQWLGFKIDWKHTFEENSPLYMQVSLDEIKIHLTEHYGDSCPGSKVLVMYDDIKDLHKSLVSKKYKFYNPAIEKTAWNSLNMKLIDPFGNTIEFFKEL